MPLAFIDLNSPPVVAVDGDNRKAMGKEKWHRTRFEKQNIIPQSLGRKKTPKWKSNLKSINSWIVSSYCGKNQKVIIIYLIIVTVTTEILVKMIVMLMNKDENK